ncbi:2-hydroxyacid dehydrogenase [Robertmurraya kyonggiensis]|uniref:D-3-phosphoglycerate dehydrogenase n=1 Tax=Robertmurraya kyonggiensis TaxID=1037680 RepID=A0A4U1D6L9_9BACI|nr:2-hydroxyacid dehydrogenase [Robertmurraya kyonggiensis]TKC18104.1 hypothetical protein FA727_00655 [Robertmurraya kyonggiensis]
MNVVYLDPVFPEMKKMLLDAKPQQAELKFAAEYEGEILDSILSEAEYLLMATEKVDRSLIEKLPRVKHIQKTGIGVDNIDLQEADKREITVSNTPGANATGVAELTILLILALYRKLIVLDKATKNGEWQMWEHRLSSYELSGKVHGFIGFGNIGQETAKLSKGFGTEIIYYDVLQASSEIEMEVDATYCQLDELLKKADIISLHVPLIPQTRHLLSEKEFDLMKSSAVLINVSRGGIVNEDELARALSVGKIAGAGIDVWEGEPPNANHPLFQFDQVIATPHIGAGTKDTLIRVLNMAFDNISSIEKGEQAKFVVSKSIHNV